MKSKLWMVSQSDAQNQNPEVVLQEGLNNLYDQTNLEMNVLHVALYIKLVNALLPHPFVSNATNMAIFPDYADLPSVHLVPIGIQGDHGMAEVEAATEVEKDMDTNLLYIKLRHLILQNL